jgi:hypothetical protein
MFWLIAAVLTTAALFLIVQGLDAAQARDPRRAIWTFWPGVACAGGAVVSFLVAICRLFV